jgi:hypothetical protein
MDVKNINGPGLKEEASNLKNLIKKLKKSEKKIGAEEEKDDGRKYESAAAASVG